MPPIGYNVLELLCAFLYMNHKYHFPLKTYYSNPEQRTLISGCSKNIYMKEIAFTWIDRIKSDTLSILLESVKNECIFHSA